MSVRIYLDTNIYLDYCEKRSDGIRPLNEFAFAVFRRTLECEFEIVISDWVINELGKSTEEEALKIIAASLKAKKKLDYVESSYEEREKAQKYKNLKDALHAIIAKRAKCKFIVTRNIVDFLQFSDILEAKLPEQL